MVISEAMFAKTPKGVDEVQKRTHGLGPRIRQMLKHENFELEWVSVYTFQCRRIDRFRHDRVLFVGDTMTDYRAAAATGLPFLGRVPPGERSPFPEGTRLVPDLAHLTI